MEKESQRSVPGSTSFRPSNSSVSESANPSTTRGSQGSRHQSDMTTLAEGEMGSATFFVDLTNEKGTFHAETKTVDTVVRELQPTFDVLTSQGESTEDDPRIPDGPFNTEPDSYKPFSDLLNKIITIANCHISIKQSPLRGLRFYPFAREVMDIYGSKNPLKPDIVGIIGELPLNPLFEETAGNSGKRPAKGSRFNLTWGQIEVSVESKDNVRKMVRQSATYARSCYLSKQRRFFSLGIGFQYKSKEAYIFVYHHGGLSSSHPMKITTLDGFNDLVKHIVGILSIKDEPAYGLDPTRFGDLFCINDRCYKSLRYIYVRGNFRGRSTIVHGLEAVDDIQGHNMESRTLTLAEGVEILPDKLIYKLTYQVKGKSQEGPLFSQFYGQFGICDVIGFYTCEAEDPHGSTSRLFNDAQYWDVFERKSLPEDNSSSPEPEDRGLQCIAFSGEGRAFLDSKTEGGIPSPGDLLESILHAIIGHYNLFSKGILHGDISSGNVLRYAEPIERPALQVFECTRNVNYCRGFLIDGDHAVKWRDSKSSGSQTISGTMSFMSVRLLGALASGQPIIHTALDDLESFLWLLIWGIVHALKDLNGAKKANPGIQLILGAWSGNAHANAAKIVHVESHWKDAVFGDLIRSWLKTFQKARTFNIEITEEMPSKRPGGKKWVEACDRLEAHCIDIYKEVLDSGFQYLAKVKEYPDWDMVLGANSRRYVKVRRFDPDE